MKFDGEIMEIFAAYDLTGSLRATAELTGCSHYTVARHVAARDAGKSIAEPAYRGRVTDEFLPKIEEWVEASKGKIRADKTQDKLVALGYAGSERSTRRAVAQVRAAFRLGQVRVHRPWITEPGMWLQYDFGDGPVIDGKKTELSRFSCRRFVGGATGWWADVFSLVDLLELLGRNVSEGAVQSVIVVPIDPVERDFLDVTFGLQRAVPKR